MSIGSGVLLPGVVEIPTFPILRPLAYTTGLGATAQPVICFYCSVGLVPEIKMDGWID